LFTFNRAAAVLRIFIFLPSRDEPREKERERRKKERGGENVCARARDIEEKKRKMTQADFQDEDIITHVSSGLITLHKEEGFIRERTSRRPYKRRAARDRSAVHHRGFLSPRGVPRGAGERNLVQKSRIWYSQLLGQLGALQG